MQEYIQQLLDEAKERREEIKALRKNIERLEAANKELYNRANSLPFKAIIRIETWDEYQLDLLSDHLSGYKGMKVEWYMTED